MTPFYQDQSTSTDLLNRTCQGSVIAQEQIYEIYCPLVYQWSRQSGLNYDDALDNAHRVFVKLFSHLPMYDRKRGKFRHWLWRMTHHMAIDHFRKVQRDTLLHRQVAVDTRAGDAPESATSDSIPRLVAQRALEVLMDHYDGRTREVAIELLVHARTAQSIAEEFEITLGSVYTIRSRALKLLRESLCELEFFPDSELGG